MGRSDSKSLRKEGDGKGGKYLWMEFIFFSEEEKKDGKGKGGKYLKDKIFFWGGGKREKIFGEGNYSFSEEKEKVGNIWRRQIFF